MPVKRVVDDTIEIRVKPHGGGVDLAGVKMGMNPFDGIAVQEASGLKASGAAAEVVAASIGPQGAVKTLRGALAMGADRGILVRADVAVEPLAVAKYLKNVVEAEAPVPVTLGKQAIDVDHNQTGQMLAAPLGWGQATFTSKDVVDGDGIQVARDVDGGAQTVALRLPAIVTTDLRLNEPRYASLPNIMKAKRPIAESVPVDHGVGVSPRLTVLRTSEPARRQAGDAIGTRKP